MAQVDACDAVTAAVHTHGESALSVLSLANSPSELGLLHIHLVVQRGGPIGHARTFLANTGLASRMRNDAPMKAPDMATFYRPGARGYTGYSALAP